MKNLKVWRLDKSGNTETESSENDVVGRFIQKSQTGWNLQFTYDEQYFARLVSNEIQFYKCGDWGTVWNKLHIDGIADFSVSPGKNHAITIFVPERKVCCLT